MAPELAKYVDSKKLVSNVRNYPELARTLTQQQKGQVEVIKRKLLEVPLLHSSYDQFPKGKDILPSIQLPPDQKTNTYPLDISLGLHRYTFFHWGFVTRSEFGMNFVLIDPQVLLDKDTIVCGNDVAKIAIVSNKPYEQLPERTKRNVQTDYFDKLVTGENWLEIVARRVLHATQEGKKLYVVGTSDELGEVKHFGPVPKKYITHHGKPSEFASLFETIYAHGIGYRNLEDSRKDPRSPSQLPSFDFAAAERYWETVLR